AASVPRLVESLHAKPRPCALAVTGGGASAVAALLAVPGASRTVVEALVPYHERSLAEFLGREPQQHCSVEVARELAAAASRRAPRLTGDAGALGLGCTASLATDRPKRGDHRFHVGVHARTHRATRSLTLAKGARDR